MTQAELTAALGVLLADGQPITALIHRNAEGLVIAEIYANRTVIGGKQETLVSGTNIKTIQGNNPLGFGNIILIDDAIVDGVVDRAPSQNKVFDELALKATIQYVNDMTSGLVGGWKNSVQLRTTANVTLSGEQTIDGVSTSVSDVLVMNQTIQSQNGIYTTGAGAWTRRADADSASELEGAAVTVTEGTLHHDTNWLQQTDNITLGSSNIVWGPLGQNAADASPSVKGIMRLYTVVGTNTDGTIDQNSLTTLFNGKASLAYADAKVANDLTASTTVAPSKTAVNNGLATKQETLISNTNIKTINGTPLLGSGSIAVPIHSSFAKGVTLTGAVDGVNNVYTVGVPIYIGSEDIFLGGQRQTDGEDYVATYPGGVATYTFVIPPETGSILRANYIRT